ncbi:hypothetical protein D3C73_1122150 [compost metagenome]
MAIEKARSLLKGSNSAPGSSFCTSCNACLTGPNSCLARTVGWIPRPQRTNSSSLNISFKRATALLTAGCDIPKKLAARVIFCICITASNTVSKFRSTLRKCSSLVSLSITTPELHSDISHSTKSCVDNSPRVIKMTKLRHLDFTR